LNNPEHPNSAPVPAELAGAMSSRESGSLNQAPVGHAPPIHPKLRWLMVLIWAGFIFYLSTSGFGPSFSKWLLVRVLSLLHVSVSPQTFEFLHFCLRKLAHLTEYCIFSLLIYISLLNAEDFEWRARLALRSIVIAGLYSLTDEYHQSFVATRTPSLIDCGIDTSGAAFGALMVFVWDRLVHTIRSRRAAVKASTAEISKGLAGP
jgi:VanZ family protein